MALHHLQQEPNGLRVEAAAAQHLAQQDADVTLEGPAVRRVARAGQAPYGPSQHDGVAQLEADRHLLHRLEHHRVEVADGPEVEEPQGAVAVDEHIPRVRVGVVGAVEEHLVEERAEQSTRQDGWGHTGRRHRGVIGDCCAVDLLHDEHPPGGEREVDPGALTPSSPRRSSRNSWALAASTA